MINKVVGIIPARKNSRRLIGKNKKLLNGKPLISYTIECAFSCYFLDEIIVSTDDEDIWEICEEYEDKIRVHKLPSECTQDDSKGWEVIVNTLKGYSNETIVIWLQPTSPLRTPEDIVECFNTYLFLQKPITTCCIDKPKHFKFNGAVYVISLGEIKKNKYVEGSVQYLYIMPQERSIDIDMIEEFKACERYLKNE